MQHVSCRKSLQPKSVPLKKNPVLRRLNPTSFLVFFLVEDKSHSIVSKLTEISFCRWLCFFALIELYQFAWQHWFSIPIITPFIPNNYIYHHCISIFLQQVSLLSFYLSQYISQCLHPIDIFSAGNTPDRNMMEQYSASIQLSHQTQTDMDKTSNDSKIF